MEDCWLADRTLLRSLLLLHPTWTLHDYAAATHRSLAWVKKWRKRFRTAPPEDDRILHSCSRARNHLPPPLDPIVIERILAIRDAPPAHLQRIPGPKAILYFLAHDPELHLLDLRLPRSTRTIWQILRQHGRIAIPSERRHTPVERPAPMTAWQLDYKDVSTVPPEPDGKQQHVVEVLNTVDMGTSILLNAQVREDFTAETTLEAVVETLRLHGRPETITLDRDPRFVGSQKQRDFPSPLMRLLHCLGIQVTICPPRRPDRNGFVERYNRTFEYECLRVFQPTDAETARRLTEGFRLHYNTERPNQAVSCGNQPPCVAFPNLPPRPPLPSMVDPDGWVDVLDGQRYVRKIHKNGTVSVDGTLYYIDQAWQGRYVSLRIQAANRAFMVEYREQVLKVVPMKGLVGEVLPLEVYLEQMKVEAKTQYIAGRPVGRQLRLPV
jgi:transposase InsO family protein